MSPELTTFVVVMIETRGGPYLDLMKKKNITSRNTNTFQQIKQPIKY